MSDPAMEVAVRAAELVEPILSGAMVAPPIMTDDEIQRAYRVASALAESRLYKDVTSAAQGFAKLLIGRTLGLNEHQSLQLYVMEGGVEVPYPMLGQFVRSRPGYDFRPGWVKEQLWASVKEGPSGPVVSVTDNAQKGKAYVIRTDDGATVRCLDADVEFVTKELVTVWLNEEDPSDSRAIVGAVIQYTTDGESRGISRWTIEDTLRAELDKDRGTMTSNHVKYPRNMYLARAMTNGIKWLVPECAAGLSVYAPGEIPRPKDLGAGEGSGEERGWGDVPIPAVHEVERLIRRAERVHYPALMDRNVWQMKLTGQPPETVRRIIQEAANELQRRENALVPEAEVVPGKSELPAEQGDGGGQPTPHAVAASPTVSDAEVVASGPAPDAEPQEPDRGETSPVKPDDPAPPTDESGSQSRLI